MPNFDFTMKEKIGTLGRLLFPRRNKFSIPSNLGKTLFIIFSSISEIVLTET